MADKSNGDRLRDWRLAKGWSQAEAAEKIGAKQGTWAPWEHGRKLPSVEHARELEELTDGAVCMRDWVKVARPKAKKRRRSRSMQSAA